MTNKHILRIFGIAVALMLLGLLSAQDLRFVHFAGFVNDYSPSTVAGGPYEIRGQWTLDVDRSGTANFSADLTMETSDYGINSTAQVDPANPATRMPHTHHIRLTGGKVTYDPGVCPANNPPTTGTTAVVVTGAATTAGNGSPAPFEAKGESTLQICITGGSDVDFSNVTLVYTGPATTHFGAQPIHGVVRLVSTK